MKLQAATALLATTTTTTTTTTSSTLPPFQKTPTSSKCCFDSVDTLYNSDLEHLTLLETHTGELRLGGTYQAAALCLDIKTQELTDGLNNTCHMNSDDLQFRCSPGIAPKGRFKMELKFEDHDGDQHAEPFQYLDYSTAKSGDWVRRYWACLVGNVAQKEGSWSLFRRRQSGVECKSVVLNVRSTQGECGLRDTETLLSLDDEKDTEPDPKPEPKPENLDPSGCIVKPGFSKTPYNLTPGIREDWKPPTELNTNNAYITPDRTTLFFWNATGLETLPADGTCAVQFSLPWGNLLPAGYPMFEWSGLEQQELAQSGMSFYATRDLLRDDFAAVVPAKLGNGSPAVVGTFRCGDLMGTGLGVHARSVNGWELEFMQAGVRNDYEDGVGVFLVQCES